MVSKYSNKTISVRSGSKDAGADTIEWNDWQDGEVYGKPSDDDWNVEKVGKFFKIVNEISGQALTEESGPEKRALQQPWKNTAEQFWRIEKVK